jgi:Trypsin-like serine proteases, typically periplasmic, contain C-terminal PDZ domain
MENKEYGGNNYNGGFQYDPGMYKSSMNSVPQSYDQQIVQPVQAKEKIAPKSKKTGKKEAGFGKVAAKAAVAAVVFGLVGGVCFQGVNMLSGKVFGGKTDTEQVAVIDDDVSSNVVSQATVNTGGSTQTVSYDVAEIVENAENSIVSITTKVTTDYTYFFSTGTDQATGAGSGIIIGKTDKVLYVATNYHVIKGADEINVGFSDGEIVKATVLGYDDGQDVAVVSVKFSDMKESTTQKITIAQIGNSDELRVGEPAIAIGNALGYGQSVTVGYISALDRTIEGSEGRFIQTDAAINPGNSGGALFNAQGQVIGINSVKYVDSKVEGMGFSIPINKAMEIINSIINGEKKAELYIGVSGVDVGKEYSQIYGFPEGIYVKSIERNSPAEQAGMYAGDIIVEIEGKEVYTIEELKSRIQTFNEGDTVQIVVYRSEMGKYNKVTLDVTVRAK